MGPYYPPLGFYFKVSFLDSMLEFNFQTISGLTKEIVTESFREGGQLYDYALPVKFQYAELVLKRGLLVPGETDLDQATWHEWFLGKMHANQVTPKDLSIELLNPGNNPVMAWNVRGAWPKKWVIADFNAEENQVVIETMELHYDYFEFNTLKTQTETTST